MKRLPALALVSALLGTSVAHADSVSHWPERYQFKTPHSSIEAGAARVAIRAPLPVVRDLVLNYRGYKSLIPKFDRATVIGRSGERTDVYLRVPILKGLASIWAVVRFEPPTQIADGSVEIVGHLLKGNVERLDATWRLKEIDEANTQLNLELLIVPSIPAPSDIVTHESMGAARAALLGMRDGAEAIQGG